MVTQINLLPWREQARETRKHQFLVVFVSSLAITLLVILLLHFVTAQNVSSQEIRNALLNQQITLLNAQVQEVATLQKQRLQLLDRMAVVQTLQLNRTEIAYILDAFVRVVPEGVYLTSIKREGDIIDITGKAQSSSRISKFMRNIGNSPWLGQPQLSEIVTEINQSSYKSSFNLAVQLHKKSNKNETRTH